MAPRSNKNKWMQRAFQNAGSGLLHKMLGVPVKEKIPLMFLQAVVDTEIGKFAHNPTQVGSKMVKVTVLMKRRANALLNADRANK
jgi:hypothetical protein